MAPNIEHQPDSDRNPHVLLGIGAIALMLVAAMTLLAVSGHVSRERGAIMLYVLGLPLLGGLLALAFVRWRAARKAREEP